jgi:hypothetical protein
MGQLKAKTMIEKSGFLDQDKKTPEHDKIQKWTYNNVEKIIEELKFFEKNSYTITQKHWEYRILTQIYKNQQQWNIVGFVDLTVFVKLWQNVPKTSYKESRIHFEIKTKIPSLGELIRQLRFYQQYLPNEHHNLIVVVCPDDEYKEILNEQGFLFYKYTDESKLF